MSGSSSSCITTPLFATPSIGILDIACWTPLAGKAPPRNRERALVVFVRRGALTAHLGSRAYLADGCTALVARQETEYQISHPSAAGCESTVFELAPEFAERAIAGLLGPHRAVALRLSPAVQAAYAGFLSVVANRPRDLLSCEEAALEVVGSALASDADRRSARRGRAAVVQAAIGLLHRDLSVSRPVSYLAQEIGCSPSHLMHTFRAETGTTLRSYRIRLRVAAALHQLAAGRADLTGLALELGFASHAHLADTFKRLLGLSPREVRSRMKRADRTLASCVRTLLDTRARSAQSQSS